MGDASDRVPKRTWMLLYVAMACGIFEWWFLPHAPWSPPTAWSPPSPEFIGPRYIHTYQSLGELEGSMRPGGETFCWESADGAAVEIRVRSFGAEAGGSWVYDYAELDLPEGVSGLIYYLEGGEWISLRFDLAQEGDDASETAHREAMVRELIAESTALESNYDHNSSDGSIIGFADRRGDHIDIVLFWNPWYLSVPQAGGTDFEGPASAVGAWASLLFLDLRAGIPR